MLRKLQVGSDRQDRGSIFGGNADFTQWMGAQTSFLDCKRLEVRRPAPPPGVCPRERLLSGGVSPHLFDSLFVRSMTFPVFWILS